MSKANLIEQAQAQGIEGADEMTVDQLKAALKSNAAQESEYTYIGPHYNNKLVLPGVGELNPKKMSDEKIAAMIKKHPGTARLFSK